MMAHFGTLKSFRFSEGDAEDIRGAAIYGLNDEKLGKIDDVIFDHATGDIHYAVVDTGGWLSSKKFIISASRLSPSAKHNDDYRVDLTKDQIEAFPPYNEKDVDSHENWKAYQKQYSKAWEDVGNVQHRADSDRNVTPTPDEMPDTGSVITGTRQPVLEDVTPERLVPTSGGETRSAITGTNIGSRWLSFEDQLRERRREVIESCTTCNRSIASETASDRERDEQRKAS
jgi:sporulation protein YlmC with PRC-barrel domain